MANSRDKLERADTFVPVLISLIDSFCYAGCLLGLLGLAGLVTVGLVGCMLWR